TGTIPHSRLSRLGQLLAALRGQRVPAPSPPVQGSKKGAPVIDLAAKCPRSRMSGRRRSRVWIRHHYHCQVAVPLPGRSYLIGCYVVGIEKESGYVSKVFPRHLVPAVVQPSPVGNLRVLT